VEVFNRISTRLNDTLVLERNQIYVM